MDERVWKVIESWNYWEREPETGMPRDVTWRAGGLLGGPEAVYFYGPRRAGKTTVCLQLLSHLSKKFGAESCLYVNFEEPSFSGILKTELISEIVERQELEFGKPPRFVFLDEVQGVPAWEKWVRAAVDKKERKVFVTGSSAKLLSSEFATTLGGRGFGFMVLPFSFGEFQRARPGARLDDYLETGGYPAVVLEKSGERRSRLLEEYFETAVVKDISARYQVRDVPTLRTLAVYVLTNSGKLFSYNKLREMTGLSFDAIKLYLSYLEDAFLAFQVPQFSYSMKKAMEKPRKYYSYDLGLQSAVSKSYSPDWGRRTEGAVAIELKRRGGEPQYYANNTEVDFVVKDGLKLTALNVCYSEKAPERETAGLEEFKKKHRNSATVLLSGEKQITKWLKEKK
ncbi:MAG: ATP-binding protein [Candidatus Micrarchaeota archaeon]